jgi:hypothetical protein
MAFSGVLVWWAALSAVALVNIALWTVSARNVLGSWEPNRDAARYRRLQLILSCAFVVGCASRSWVLRADVQRFCMIDSFLGSVFVGRSIATIAELSFVAQWALLVRALAERGGNRFAFVLSRIFVPTIFVAEGFSWYAILTTNYFGNAIEESLWTLTAALLTVSLVTFLPSASAGWRRFLVAGVCFGVAYLVFMTRVDVPMYVTRWRADEASGRAYLSLSEGLRDAMSWHVTLRWEDWRDEMPWMSLYFSAAVWASLALIHVPVRARLSTAAASAQASPS